jgi:hypothetical protein
MPRRQLANEHQERFVFRKHNATIHYSMNYASLLNHAQARAQKTVPPTRSCSMKLKRQSSTMGKPLYQASKLITLRMREPQYV